MPMNEDDVYRFALVQRQNQNELLINTFAFRVASVNEPEEEDTILESMFNALDGGFTTAISAPFRGVQHETVRHEKWTVQKVSPVEEQPRDYILDALGGDDGSCSTYNTAVSVTRYGDEGGRRNRGRIALGGLDDQHYDEGILGPASKILFNLATQNIVGTYTAVGGIFVLQLGFWVPAHSAIVGGVLTTYPAKFTWCRRRTVRDNIRVQRSRTRGYGR
jgi:hypothetical protein